MEDGGESWSGDLPIFILSVSPRAFAYLFPNFRASLFFTLPYPRLITSCLYLVLGAQFALRGHCDGGRRCVYMAQLRDGLVQW